MSGDRSHNDSQIDSGSRVNDSHKHKDKYKDKEHKHKDHKKDREREKSKYGNSDHKEFSEKKHREKERIKHEDVSTDRHKDKHKEKDHRKEEIKPKKEKENGFASPHRIKTEPDNDHFYHSPKSLKRQRDNDETEFKPKKIKIENDRVDKKAKKRKQDEVRGNLWILYLIYFSDPLRERILMRLFLVKDIKPKKTQKNKKGEVADGKKKAKKEPEEKWKWWEEERATDGSKWRFLEHKGPVMAAPYETLPSKVRFFYDGKQMKLGPEAEEVATFFAKMLDHEYTTKDAFRKNFFKDWRKEMTSEEKSKITDLKKCNFNEMGEYFKAQSEARKAMTKDDKLKIKVENERLLQEYGFCIMDNHKERIANFRIEPPGLFRGRGDHPKMGMLKRRIRPEDIIINCSKDSKHPKPPPGTKWKELRHDNKVTWLVSWTENIQGSIKYIMLNPSSRIKAEKDWQKYETARNLKKCVDRLRNQYREDWKSKEMRIRQRAVALYFIDKLALRAGNEKEEGESADTVGCCSLRVEHINLYPEKDGQEFVVEFDFLGKDSIRYYNKVPVEKRVFKNLQLFMENKQPEDDLFDRLNTSILNKHLQELMDGLTAKVFRTYNASITLQQQLKELTSPDENLPAKILSYNRANRAVAILCNHQRALPKTFEKSMQNLQTKIDAKKDQLSDAKRDVKSAKADLKVRRDEKSKKAVETKKKAVERLEEQLMKLEVQATDREENKQIALGTSKLNYLDPRISVAWCKKWGIPIEKIYNKTQREKFAWAIDMAEDDYEF
ncbi:DNA topoisomerase I, like isoform X2 [Salvelinus fontinalis]|uniref:DNA topoisomerase I, like isoform X2 n=1 Tax=Salvelinus fontinalis TaxID=8038 RepID=UPI0024856608|nr:DNA topoisomerase I, like isoform X2 [Salvelinus fontinalis]